MERDNLYFVLFEQQKDFEQTKGLVNREKTDEITKLSLLKMPIIITGIRRCGKSSLLKLIKNKLKLKEKEHLYIDFIDEIQEVKGWEKWVERIRKKHIVFISGSNSKLLSKEISTVLTGRSINFNLYPFSFREFLEYKKIDIKNWKISLGIQSKIRKNFDIFIETGGFTQRILSNNDIIVSELYENILYRDIISKFNKNLSKPIKEISLYLISNISSDISLRTLSSFSGIKNIATVKKILDAFENAFLYFTLNKFDYSIKKQIQNPKKIYCVDNGIVTTQY